MRIILNHNIIAIYNVTKYIKLLANNFILPLFNVFNNLYSITHKGSDCLVRRVVAFISPYMASYVGRQLIRGEAIMLVKL